jgi:integrase
MKRHIPAYPSKPHKSGQARIRIGGRDYYLGVWGSAESRQQYARLVTELAAGVDLAARLNPGTITVADVTARYMEDTAAARGTADHELVNFRSAIAVLVGLYGTLPAADLGTPQLRAVRQAMLTGSLLSEAERTAREQAGRPLGWCRNVANRQIVRIRTIWRWAEETAGLVPRGSWGHLCSLRSIARNDKRARQTAARQPATWEQVQAALRHVPPAVAVMLELQWWTGMRPSELVKMRACDVRKDGPEGTWLYRLEQHKNSWREGAAPEDVVLGPECQRVLGPWLEAARNRGADAWLFPTSHRRSDRHYTTGGYAVAVKRVCAQHGIPHFTPYQLRHACAERVLQSSGLDAARAVLRQASIGTTEIYAKDRDRRIAAEAARKTG